MNEKEYQKQRFALTVLLTMVTFGVMLLAVVISGVLLYFMVRKGILLDKGTGVGFLLCAMAIASSLIGSGIVLALGKIPLRPINRLISQMNRLASGDFTARIHFGRPITNHSTFTEISDSFNKMAEELENTEMLRSDFINNFSHEFKTPIVSIAGFAKLLKRGNLSDEQKQEYIEIIESESMRLASMATNVLNLTKVENQTILSDITEYNLSEQIRSCVLLLENQWSKKNLDLHLDFEEHIIHANEDLMKQVWMNLMDNAVKFTPIGGTVKIEIKEQGDECLQVSVLNTGSEIPEEHQKRIFNKFYQVDPSHSGQGNGVGLAIVKRVVELHGGQVTVQSGNEITEFTVNLH